MKCERQQEHFKKDARLLGSTRRGLPPRLERAPGNKSKARRDKAPSQRRNQTMKNERDKEIKVYLRNEGCDSQKKVICSADLTGERLEGNRERLTSS